MTNLLKNQTRALVLILVMVCNFSFSQEDKDNKQVRQVKNEFSFEVLQVINGVYQLSYERHIWKNFSASISYGHKSKEGLVKFSGINTDKLKTNELFYTGNMIIPEVRYYINGTSKLDYNLSGFYIGAYYKFSDYKSDLKGRYTDSNGTNYDIAFRAKLDISSVGLMIGYKLQLTKRFNIDFLIAGPGTGKYKFNLKNTQDLPDEFYDDLNDALENYDLLDILDSDFRFSKVNRKSDFSTVSFRYGIAIGYTF